MELKCRKDPTMPTSGKNNEETYDSANDSDIGIAEEADRPAKRQKVKKSVLTADEAKKKIETMKSVLDKSNLKKMQIETNLMMIKAKIMKTEAEILKMTNIVSESS